jgi:hypothetical protein
MASASVRNSAYFCGTFRSSRGALDRILQGQLAESLSAHGLGSCQTTDPNSRHRVRGQPFAVGFRKHFEGRRTRGHRTRRSVNAEAAPHKALIEEHTARVPALSPKYHW